MNIPAKVLNNHNISTYTVFDEQGHIVFQAKRKPLATDKAPILDGEFIKEPGIYYGEWYDNTAKAQEEAKAKKKVFAKPSEVVTKTQNKHDEELAQAEALLAALLGNKKEDK